VGVKHKIIINIINPLKMNKEQKEQIASVLNALGEGLDVTPTEYEQAISSYQAVGNWLAAEGSSLEPYQPEILPQGSFLLGTMTRPVNESDDLDIDLVCRLSGIKGEWTQYQLKQAVGFRLKEHGVYIGLLQPEGRRNWTLQYADDRRFHMDILPAVVGHGFYTLLEKSMSAEELQHANDLAIRITDTRHPLYNNSLDLLQWPSSNMFGFAAWFRSRSQITALRKAVNLHDAIRPVPKLERHKLPLQRVVQILKRHRDIMFNGDKHKPISIIITTLAAWAYEGEDDVLTALSNVVTRMENFMETRYDAVQNKYFYWIGNPVNAAENFADKWPLCDEKQVNFLRWLVQVKKDVSVLAQQQNLETLREAIEQPFGPSLIKSVFSNIGVHTRELRESGRLYMAAGTGLLGTTGRAQIPNHKYYGSDE
jgi:hypothetical protein